MSIRSIDDLDVSGRTVFLRVDFNVPLRDGTIQDDTRIRAALPTLRGLTNRGARVVAASHLGRPKGAPDPAYSLGPVAARLGELLAIDVPLAPGVVGADVRSTCAALEEGRILLLENVRFHPGETKNDPELSRELADLADAYVNDAFGTCHRAHATTGGVPEYFAPDQRAAGYLLLKEIQAFDRILRSPDRPFVAILGGAKVSDKIGVIRNLLERVDKLLIGGAMAYTFLAAEGVPIGDSLVEADKVELARELLAEARDREVNLLLPSDHVVAKGTEEPDSARSTEGPAVPDGLVALDIGPKTREIFRGALQDVKTVVWNGPMGVFEVDGFAEGTFAVAQAVADCQGFTVVGGGDSVSAVQRSGMADRVDHLSTGGGATLELLEGKTLPGIAVLDT